MKMNLYNIEQEFETIANDIIENGGALTPELEKAFEINAEQLQKKGINIGYVVKSISNDIELIEKEEKRLKALKESRKKTIERLKEVLAGAMENHSIIEIKTETLTINFSKSSVVEVQDINLLDPAFKTIKVTPDKVGIKNYLKAGGEVFGAKIVQKQNIQIK